MDENAINENPYRNSNGPIEIRKTYAALHNNAFCYTMLCLMTDSKPDCEHEILYNKGLMEIAKNKEKALKFENRIKTKFKMNNTSNIEAIIESYKQTNVYSGNNNPRENRAA
jgi:hypothetical protein